MLCLSLFVSCLRVCLCEVCKGLARSNGVVLCMCSPGFAWWVIWLVMDSFFRGILVGWCLGFVWVVGLLGVSILGFYWWAEGFSELFF